LVAEKIEIDYRNHSPADTFPGGNYRSYLRVLVPLGSRLKKVTLDKLAVAEEKIDVTSLHGKTVFGFLVEVPVQQGRLVEVTYELPTKIELQAVTQYRLLVQKQSGSAGGDFESLLQLPETAKITWQYPANLEINGTQIKFSDNLLTDKFYGMVLGR